MTTKRCFKCGGVRPLSEFYRHPRMADGLLGKCKECTKADSALSYRRKSRDPKWLARERRRQIEKQTANYLKYREKYPEKWAARRALSNAVQRGRVVKPSWCQRCGTPCLPDGHHKDYSKPLEVEWLCRRCHVKADGRARPE